MDSPPDPDLYKLLKDMFIELMSLPPRKEVSKSTTKVVNDVNGMIQLTAAPHYKLTFIQEKGEIRSYYPLSVPDSTRYLPQLISLVGKRVCFLELSTTVEVLTNAENKLLTNAENKSMAISINLVVKFEHIRVADMNMSADYKLENIIPTTSTSSENIAAEETNVNTTLSEYRIMVHHVSLPFYYNIGQISDVFSIVYISYLNSINTEKKLWLVLQSNQVCWKEFLIPNREYIIKMPSKGEPHYFDENQKNLDRIFNPLNRELRVIYHHRDLFQTMKGCTLPRESKLFLTNNTNMSNFINKLSRFSIETFSPWLSVEEACRAKAELITCFGHVHAVQYDTDIPHQYCYVCKRAMPNEPVITEFVETSTYPWLNPLQSSLTLDHTTELEIPLGESESSKQVSRGKLVQIISLRDINNCSEVCVYIKHSHLPNILTPTRIVPGTVLCISNLVRRRATSGRVYFIATLLTDFKILSCGEEKLGSWGRVGLYLDSTKSQDKIWGVLDAFSLVKVSISAKCSGCRSVFYENRCSEECSARSCTISAIAICRINITFNKQTVSTEKVLIKDHFVQKLLQIPDNVWRQLLDASCHKEILCTFSDVSENESPNELGELLKIYCKVPKATGEFFISVRKLHNSPDDEPVFFCLNLEPMNHKRLQEFVKLTKRELKQ